MLNRSYSSQSLEQRKEENRVFIFFLYFVIRRQEQQKTCEKLLCVNNEKICLFGLVKTCLLASAKMLWLASAKTSTQTQPRSVRAGRPTFASLHSTGGRFLNSRRWRSLRSALSVGGETSTRRGVRFSWQRSPNKAITNTSPR